MIGLTGGQSQLHYQDLREDEALTHHLHFIKQPSALRAVPEGQIALRNYFDPDNSRMLLVYPASWPVPLSEEIRVTWLMLSEGAGFNDGTLAIHVNGPDGLAITRGYMEGSKFHNGQIVGPLETAPRDTTGASVEDLLKSRQFEVTQEPAGSAKRSPRDFRRWTFRRRHLSGRRRFSSFSSCIWWLHRSACGTSMCPCGRRHARTSSTICLVHGLPPSNRRGCLSSPVSTPRPVTRQATLPTLPPRGPLMLDELQHKQTTILLDRALNHFAIASNVAIVAGCGSGDARRVSILSRSVAAAPRRTDRGSQDSRRETHDRAGLRRQITKDPARYQHFSVTRRGTSCSTLPSNYQTVLATIFPKDAEYPIAGVGLQVGLEDYPEQWREHHEQQLADTLSKMRGRPFDRAPVVNTVHVFNWVLNHADCYRYLGTSIGDMKDRLDDFAAQHPVLQAWHSQCTWQPLFDHADDYHRTVYEEHSVLNWFRGILQTDGGLNASKMSLQWCSNVLRMVTPHMWVCRALLQQVDRAALEAVAQVTETNDAFKIALREGQGLDDLELALLPVLPVESVRIHAAQRP